MRRALAILLAAAAVALAACGDEPPAPPGAGGSTADATWRDPTGSGELMNLREVALFPMNQRAEDLLMGGPSEASTKQLRELHIRLNLPQD